MKRLVRAEGWGSGLDKRLVAYAAGPDVSGVGVIPESSPHPQKIDSGRLLRNGSDHAKSLGTRLFAVKRGRYWSLQRGFQLPKA